MKKSKTKKGKSVKKAGGAARKDNDRRAEDERERIAGAVIAEVVVIGIKWAKEAYKDWKEKKDKEKKKKDKKKKKGDKEKK